MLNRADIESLLTTAAKSGVSTLEVGPDGSLKAQFAAPRPPSALEVLRELDNAAGVSPPSADSGDSSNSWLDFQPPPPPPDPTEGTL